MLNAIQYIRQSYIGQQDYTIKYQQMIAFVHQQFEPIKRSMSYNDLKKKRMLRSVSNRGKLATIKDKVKDKSDNHAVQILQHTQKFSKISPNPKLIEKLPQIMNEIETHKENQLSKLKDYSHKFSRHEQNNDRIAESKTLGCKKMKSMRILTKLSTKNLTSTTKLNPNILKRIDKVEASSEFQEKFHSQCSSHYHTVDSHQNSNMKTKQESEKQNIFFNAISPIQEKNQRRSISNVEEVSGFSILNDIQQKYQEQSSRLPNILKQKLKVPHFDMSKNPHGLDLIEHDIKMPKIAKRRLPKDFFLRV